MNFSLRTGKKTSFNQLQLESINDDLRNGIWNSYLTNFIGHVSMPSRFGNTSIIDHYITILWAEFFKLRVDERYPTAEQNAGFIKKRFFEFEWFEVYDFIEFHLTQSFLIRIEYPFYFFVEDINRTLEREFSGYRLIENNIVPISNEIEVNEIKEAINSKPVFNSPNKAVNFHLNAALSKLSDKKNPDFRNSIKESISAVETLCRQLTEKATLGEALKTLEQKGIILNPQLKNAFDKLYAYTNNKDSGIRHALIESPNLPTFHDAKFMLVACSAFINYVIGLTK
ncbi:MAG: hypothetical protein V4450_10560 [Bacteroidota bacterium]